MNSQICISRESLTLVPHVMAIRYLTAARSVSQFISTHKPPVVENSTFSGLRLAYQANSQDECAAGPPRRQECNHHRSCRVSEKNLHSVSSFFGSTRRFATLCASGCCICEVAGSSAVSKNGRVVDGSASPVLSLRMLCPQL